VVIRQQLIEQGVFVADVQGLILSQSYEFNSPTQAAVMLLARTANGLIEWKDASGLTPARAPSKTAELGWRTKLGLASITS